MAKIKHLIIMVVFIMGATALLTPMAAFGAEQNLEKTVSLNTLVNESAKYDGKRVVVQGEVLLEALERKDYAWLNINDGTNAIGVTVPLELLKQIRYYGDYKHKGDVLTLVGEFHRACPEHGGDLDIHLIELKSVKTGSSVTHRVSSLKWGVTLALFAMAGLSAYLYRRVSRQ